MSLAALLRIQFVSLLFLATGAVQAQGDTRGAPALPNTVGRVALLPADSETVLALGAAPPSVAAGAAVYVLKENGYVKVRDGTNGFTCYIQHNHPQDRIPRCDDAGGTAYLLPIYMRREELRAAGKTTAEIKADLAEGFRSGRIRAPPAAGIAYMLGATCFFDPQKNACGAVIEPYMMVFAPFKVGADIGFPETSPRENVNRKGLPISSSPEVR